jgi:hypothetical protein
MRDTDSLPSNGTTTITKSEFSDDNFDEEEVQDEESAPDDGMVLPLFVMFDKTWVHT